MVRVPASRSESIGSTRTARSAGTAPKIAAVTRASTPENSRTGRLRETAPTRGIVTGPYAVTTRFTATATTSPRTAPPIPSSRLSAEHVPDQAGAAGAQRRPNRHVAMARLGPGEHQAGHVRAGDQQQEPDRREQQDDGRSHLSENLVLQADGQRTELHVGRVEAVPREAGGEGAEFGGGRIRRGAGREFRGGVEPMAAALDGRRVDRQGDPQLGRLRRVLRVVGRQLEAGRHHADDRVRPAVEVDRAPQNARIAAELAMPEPMAENRDGVLAGHVFRRRERAAEQRLRAQRVEQVGRDLPEPHPHGVAGSRQVDLPDVPRRHALHAAELRAVVHELRVGHPRLVPALPLAPDHHAAGGFGVGERRQQNRVSDAEDRRRRADAERQREQRGRGEAGRPAEPAEGVSKVLLEGVDDGQAAAIAVSLLHLVDAAEVAAGGQAGGLGAHPLRLVLARLHLQVERHLVVEVLLLARPANGGHQPLPHRPDHRSSPTGRRNRPMSATVRAHCGFLVGDPPPARARELVEPGAAVVVGDAPPRADPAALLQAEQRRVERALVELEQPFRDPIDSLREPESVLRPHRFERAEDHQVERALEDVGARVLFRHPTGIVAELI